MVPGVLLLDVDGVLTDGKKIRDLCGSVIAKRFFERDFTHIKVFQKIFPVVFVSGDTRVNACIAQDRGIPFIHTGSGPKLPKVLSWLDKNNHHIEEAIYVGDDLPDISVLQAVGHSYCPRDACFSIKPYCRILPVDGGHGVVEILYLDLRSRWGKELGMSAHPAL